MKTTLNVTKTQAQLSKLIRKNELIAISRHGETIAYLVPREEMHSILETLELVSNPGALRALRAQKAGRTKFLPLSALDEDKG